MLNISNQNIKQAVINNQELFFDLINMCSLEKTWQRKNFLEIEIKKSFIRGILRYSIQATKLANLISDQIKSYDQLSTFTYFTRVYPMIHLSEDLSEESHLHFDQDNNNDLMTCWLPITENDYSPISYLKLQNKYLKKVFSKMKFPNLMMNSIRPKIGELNFWDGHFVHKGNYNSSKKISCAFQMKISKNKYDYELSIKNNELLIGENVKDYVSQYNNLLSLINKLNEINFKNDHDEQISKVANFLKVFYNKKNLEISFALSVLAQRVKVHGKKFEVKNYSYKSYLYDICSILLGCENLISLKRISEFSKKNNINLFDYLNKNDLFKIIPNKINNLNEINKN